MFLLAVLAFLCFSRASAQTSPYSILPPMQAGSLTIFPVVSSIEHPRAVFRTLDEGAASGDVVIGERGALKALSEMEARGSGNAKSQDATMNELAIVNKSHEPLLLLAGEVLIGGRQDRVVAETQLIPPQSGPVSLHVLCVEVFRWSFHDKPFQATSFLLQPTVRLNTFGGGRQAGVWNSTGDAQRGARKATRSTGKFGSSYAGIMKDKQVQVRLAEFLAPISQEYEKRKPDLEFRNAVGIVVAINGEIVGADVFASTELLEAYWPKLLMSYGIEAMSRGGSARTVGEAEALAFLKDVGGNEKSVHAVPDLYRRTEIQGVGYWVSELKSLIPAQSYEVHMNKLAETKK